MITATSSSPHSSRTTSSTMQPSSLASSDGALTVFRLPRSTPALSLLPPLLGRTSSAWLLWRSSPRSLFPWCRSPSGRLRRVRCESSTLLWRCATLTLTLWGVWILRACSLVSWDTRPAASWRALARESRASSLGITSFLAIRPTVAAASFASDRTSICAPLSAPTLARASWPGMESQGSPTKASPSTTSWAQALSLNTAFFTPSRWPKSARMLPWRSAVSWVAGSPLAGVQCGTRLRCSGAPLPPSLVSAPSASRCSRPWPRLAAPRSSLLTCWKTS
mmetsp:Transcript_3874/g.9089  ORF Transcript_3874/g.9089 Transcript_3874/m.9089 type:complete len:278 (+) Transcript_3874:887-1720(+)